MNTRKSDFYLNAKKVWSSVITKEPMDFQALGLQLDVHKRLLNIFQAGRYYYMVFNVYDAELEFVSPQISNVLGYDAGEITAMFFMNKIHPDDKTYFLSFETRATKFLKSLPLEKRGSYKSQHDYRIRAKNGRYVRLLHQILPIEFDENNYFRSLVLHTDITHLKPAGTPGFSIIGLDNEPSYYNLQDTKIISKSFDLFTRREREILRGIIEGKSSKDMAHEMFLSIHTVNTHRKNILQKAECKTSVDLVTKSVLHGWL